MSSNYVNLLLPNFSFESDCDLSDESHNMNKSILIKITHSITILNRYLQQNDILQ